MEFSQRNVASLLQPFDGNGCTQYRTLGNSPSSRYASLSEFERAGKKLSHNSQYQFWQQHNQTIALHSKDDLEKKLNYIHENPVVARFVDHEEEYPYSSAIDYSGQKGLVEIVKMY